MTSPVEIICCYARKDQTLLAELKAHLMPLQRQGLISIWSDTDIDAGEAWEEVIEEHLETAQIILLLISPDFMNSDYCYSKELKHAMERHGHGNGRLIPIILRPTAWKGASFGKLQALPKDAKPVTSWNNRDEAFISIADGVRRAAEGVILMSVYQYPRATTSSRLAFSSWSRTLILCMLVSIAVLIVPIVILFHTNIVNNWVMGGLIGGIAALLIAIPISLALFNYIALQNEKRLLAQEQEEIEFIENNYDL